MKVVIAIVGLILLAIAGFLVTSNQAAAPSPEDEMVTTGESEISTNANEAKSDTDTDTETDTEVQAMTFTIDAFNFGYSQEEIRVPIGTEVTINLTNSGGFHDWVVDEFGAATGKISAGSTTSVTFIADESGTYEYYCSVGNHRAQGMVGTLVVE